jgi:hypothetical protein
LAVVGGRKVGGLLRFLKGVAGNPRVERGFLMVKMWWDAWWVRCVSTMLFGCKKYANVLRFIFGWPGGCGLGRLSMTDLVCR